MDDIPNDNHAIAALQRIKILDATPQIAYAKQDVVQCFPSLSLQRKTESLDETPFDLDATEKDGALHEHEGGADSSTVLYLAYGSNLCAQTFQKRRGIRPLSQTNVVVPELTMTFDLAGLPYLEPCFANTRYRVENPSTTAVDEKSGLLSDAREPPKYRKTRWKKGLVGVVYEVTTKDYAHIIATEGGGASYQDILVECYELSPGEDIVPAEPTSQPFKVHTLYSPPSPTGQPPPKTGGRISRPDPNYAQASQRYLNLLTTGAEEHSLPNEYKTYLYQIRPYIMTTKRQLVGRVVFLMVWVPIVSPIFALNRIFADKRGRSPAWLRAALQIVFNLSWTSYDRILKRVFGDGERTMNNQDCEDQESGVD